MIPSPQRLEYSAVLTINGQQAYVVIFYGLHDNMACGHQCLFIGKGNILARFYGGQCRTKTGVTNHSAQYSIHIFISGSGKQAFLTA